MSTELQDFRELIIMLFREGQTYLNKNSQIISTMPCSRIKWYNNDRVLEKALSELVGDLGNLIIPIEAPSGHNTNIVGLWCKWDFSNAKPNCQIEILIYQALNQVYGFRIDPPHTLGDKHNYWHSQFTHRFGNQTLFFPSSNATWISQKTPAYPIALEQPGTVSPQDATVYAILSLYGKDIPRKILAKIKAITKLDTSLRHIVGSVTL